MGVSRTRGVGVCLLISSVRIFGVPPIAAFFVHPDPFHFYVHLGILEALHDCLHTTAHSDNSLVSLEVYYTVAKRLIRNASPGLPAVDSAAGSAALWT
jgi:hypothetical protein